MASIIVGLIVVVVLVMLVIIGAFLCRKLSV